jgi:hypothetical protein
MAIHERLTSDNNWIINSPLSPTGKINSDACIFLLSEKSCKHESTHLGTTNDGFTIYSECNKSKCPIKVK